MKRSTLTAFVLMICLAVGGVRAAELQKFSGVRLIPDGGNDGDSFLVHLDKNRDVRVRLYFVDCPESGATWDSDFRRIREQRRYFGLPDEKMVVDYGNRATAFTAEKLKRPFTVYTSFASALGRFPHGRVYGFVETADGEDLSSLLVAEGLARVYGVGRETPHGIKRDEVKTALSDLEAAAMLRNAGAWEQSDPDQLAAMRAEQRKEESELKNIRSGIKTGDDAEITRVSVNKATKKELQAIPGVGPAIAGRIIAARPVRKMDDLLVVKGITKAKLAVIKKYLICP